MLRLALSLLSSLQVGARIKDAVDRSLRQVAIVALAVGVLIAAMVFALVAAYFSLISGYGFSPAGAAGLLALILALLGGLILVVLRVSERPKQPDVPTPAEGMALLDQGLGKAMQQVNPLTLLAVAFVAGLLAGRRR
ncbi:MAG: hypothetical protein ACOYB4_07670 [Methyloceanibacter sp.]